MVQNPRQRCGTPGRTGGAGEHGRALRPGLAAAPEGVESLTQTNFAHNLRR